MSSPTVLLIFQVPECMLTRDDICVYGKPVQRIRTSFRSRRLQLSDLFGDTDPFAPFHLNRQDCENVHRGAFQHRVERQCRLLNTSHQYGNPLPGRCCRRAFARRRPVEEMRRQAADPLVRKGGVSGMKRKIKKNRAPAGLLVIALTVGLPLFSYSASFTIDAAADKTGLLPYVIFSLTVQSPSGEDILPYGQDDAALLGVLDSGAASVLINDSNPGRTNRWYGFADDAAILGLNTTKTNSDPPVTIGVDVRITGMARSLQTTLGTPPAVLPWIAGPGLAGEVDADIKDIVVRTDAGTDITLIGAPVSLQVKVLIDYTTVIGRLMPKSLDTKYMRGKGPVQSPNMSFNPPADYQSEVKIFLQRFGPRRHLGGVYDVDQRLWMYGIELHHGGNTLAAPVDGDLAASGIRFMYDTGSDVSLISQSVAESLGLYDPDAPDEIHPDGYLTIDGTEGVPGWKLESVVMAGQGGTYIVKNAWFFIDPNLWTGSEIDPAAAAFDGAPVDVVIGSNLFMHTVLLYDGPNDILELGVKAKNNVPAPPKRLKVITK